jgi:hypothetical protein
VSGRPGTGEADDPLSAPPTVSSGESAVVDGPEPVNPPMPPSTPGQRTMDAP